MESIVNGSTPLPPLPPLPWVLTLVVYSPFYAVGIFGNGLLIYIITQDRKLWTNVNFYILNLSVANFLECLTVVVSPSLGDSSPLCLIPPGLQDLSVCVAVYSLLAIINEAYNNVAHPLYHDNDISNVAALLVSIWTFACVFGFGNQVFSALKCRTVMVQHGVHSPLFEFVVIYFGPLLFIFICYVFIIRELYFLTHLDAQQSKQIRLIWKKLSTVVVVLVVTYFASFSPYYCLRLLKFFKVVSGCDTLLGIFYTLTNLHFCMNPIILYSFSKPCRVQFNKYLSQIVCMSHPQPVVSDTYNLHGYDQTNV